MCFNNHIVKVIYLIFLVIFLTFQVKAKSFSFEKSTPVLNVDSLEVWLASNQLITEDRLINLIKLERSYAWVNQHKSGRYLPELIGLDSLGYGLRFKASVLYVKAINAYLRNEHAVSFKFITEAYDLFQVVKDQEGIFYASCLFLQLRFDKSGDNILIGSNFDQVYLKIVKDVIKRNKDIHAIIQAQKTLFVYNNSIDPDRDGKVMEIEAKSLLNHVKSNPKIAYAQYIIYMFVSLSYHYQGRYLDSYQSNLLGLRLLSLDQQEERVNTLYNLSVDCLLLGKFQESWLFNREVLHLLNQSSSKHFSMYEGVYSNLMYLAEKLGFHSEIPKFADSSVYFVKLDIAQKQANTLLALEQLYEKEKKEEKIKELEKEKRQYILFFLIVLFFVLIILLLLFKIYRTNKALRNLILLREDFIRSLAHDLRRPMHAFTGLSDIFAKLILKGDTQSINRIAQSIDISGLAVRQTLDNLLYWAMDQKESVLVKFEPIPLARHLESIKSLFVGVMEINGQKMIIECPDELEVFTDPNALSLILRNIFDNATKHTPDQGEIWVVVYTRANGAYIKIEDCGVGMEDDLVKRIRSILANPKINRPHKMIHGLGLYLVAIFAQKIKVQIILESNPEVGTTYTIGPFDLKIK